MAIEIKEEFEIDAPIEQVWDYVLDPSKIVTCMPGASLDEVIDERTFDGSIKVKVGAVMAAYKGRIELTEVDVVGRTIQMTGEGKERGGGTAKATMTGRLRSTDGGGTAMIAEASVDLTGKIMQVGRGMIQGVSHQLFAQFVKKLSKNLQTEGGGVGAANGNGTVPSSQPSTASATSQSVAQEDDAIAVLPLLLKTIWAGIVGFFRRLFQRLFGGGS